MTFQPNVPLAGDLISQSQADLNTNFTQINTVFGIDHVEFDDGTVGDRGTHKQITINNVLGADPGLASPIASLYTKTTAGVSELFFQNGALAANVSQLTGSNGTLASDGAFKFATGLILKWGSGFGADGDTISFAASPAFTTCYQVIVGLNEPLGGNAGNTAAWRRSHTANDFLLGVSRRISILATSASYSYIAVGV